MFSQVNFEVKKGDRIAQLICERIFYPDLVEEVEVRLCGKLFPEKLGKDKNVFDVTFVPRKLYPQVLIYDVI